MTVTSANGGAVVAVAGLPVAQFSPSSVNEGVDTTSGLAVTVSNTRTPTLTALTIADDPLGVWTKTDTLEITLSDGTIDATRESEYPVTLTLTDNIGGSSTREYFFPVNQVKPILQIETWTIEEQVANGTDVGTAIATDPQDGTISWSIVTQSHAGTFSVTSGGLLEVADNTALVYATNPSLTVTLRATTSPGAETRDGVWTINLTEIASSDIVFAHELDASQSDGLTYYPSVFTNRDSVTNAYRRYLALYASGTGIVRSTEQIAVGTHSIKHVPGADGSKGRGMIGFPGNTSEGVNRKYPYEVWTFFSGYIWFSSAHASGLGGTPWELYFQRHNKKDDTPYSNNPAFALEWANPNSWPTASGSDFTLKIARRSASGVHTYHQVPAGTGWQRIGLRVKMTESASTGGLEYWWGDGTSGAFSKYLDVKNVQIGYSYTNAADQWNEVNLGPYQGALQSSRVIYTAGWRGTIDESAAGADMDPDNF